MNKLRNWNEIKDSVVWDTLVLGNGASMEISGQFSYASIKNVALDKGYLSEDVKSLFDFFKTDDFEYILGMLINANTINLKLKIEDKRTAKAYENIRRALIKAIGDIHVPWHKAKGRLSALAKFMKQFRTVLSLNYDLVVYWAMLVGNDDCRGTVFKDCFNKGVFCEDWERLYKPHEKVTTSTLVFYPHGNLILMRDIYGLERKISAGSSAGLLKRIFSEWEKGRGTPIFVAEGAAIQKYKAIHRSEYLRTVYDDVLKKVGGNLVIYGWGMGSGDQHILGQLSLNGAVRNIALSVHESDKESDVHRKLELLKAKFPRSHVQCFSC